MEEVDECHAMPNASSIAPSQETAELEVIVPNGDLTLRVRDGDETGTSARFQVSSEVLQVSSTYFSTFFKEVWNQQVDADNAAKTLQDDDVEMMRIILKYLHHQTKDLPESLTSEELTRLLIQCDKYDLCSALRLYILQLYEHIDIAPFQHDANHQLGCLFMGPVIIQNNKLFETVSLRVLKELTPGFEAEWSKHELASVLSAAALGRIHKSMRETRQQVSNVLLSVVDVLRQQGRVFTTNSQTCTACGKTLLKSVRACRFCHNDKLIERGCTVDWRISRYLKELADLKLWPVTQAVHDLAIVAIVERLDGSKLTHKSHVCGAAAKCPLFAAMREAQNRVKNVIRQMDGLTLEDMKD